MTLAANRSDWWRYMLPGIKWVTVGAGVARGGAGYNAISKAYFGDGDPNSRYVYMLIAS